MIDEALGDAGVRHTAAHPGLATLWRSYGCDAPVRLADGRRVRKASHKLRSSIRAAINLLALIAAMPELTIGELLERPLAERGVMASRATR
ncbi:hypothetical protein FEV16_07360 [Methylocystis sp. B8]|nr:hypothetical protein FEV16_07360 [Methylocystis sp. B8]